MSIGFRIVPDRPDIELSGKGISAARHAQVHVAANFSNCYLTEELTRVIHRDAPPDFVTQEFSGRGALTRVILAPHKPSSFQLRERIPKWKIRLRLS